jgi:hypothetical protein
VFEPHILVESFAFVLLLQAAVASM